MGQCTSKKSLPKTEKQEHKQEGLRSLNPRYPEYKFFKNYFKNLNLDEQFEERVGESFYIQWDFYIGETGLIMAEQYRRVLEMVSQEIRQNPPDNIRQLYGQARRVFQRRENDHNRYPENLQSRIWNAHHEVLILWEGICHTCFEISVRPNPRDDPNQILANS